MIAQVDARGARLAHRDPVEGRNILGGFNDVVEERPLIRHVVDEENSRPTSRIHTGTNVGEVVGRQLIDRVGLVGTAPGIGVCRRVP